MFMVFTQQRHLCDFDDGVVSTGDGAGDGVVSAGDGVAVCCSLGGFFLAVLLHTALHSATFATSIASSGVLACACACT